MKNLAGAFDTLSGASTNIAPDQTVGWTGQITFGSNKKKGEWQLGYQYKYLEADAVYAELSDSDWGLGGTDRKGHAVKATYNFQDWWQLGLTAFITEKGIARAPTRSRPSTTRNCCACRSTTCGSFELSSRPRCWPRADAGAATGGYHEDETRP